MLLNNVLLLNNWQCSEHIIHIANMPLCIYHPNFCISCKGWWMLKIPCLTNFEHIQRLLCYLYLENEDGRSNLYLLTLYCKWGEAHHPCQIWIGLRELMPMLSMGPMLGCPRMVEVTWGSGNIKTEIHWPSTYLWWETPLKLQRLGHLYPIPYTMISVEQEKMESKQPESGLPFLNLSQKFNAWFWSAD